MLPFYWDSHLENAVFGISQILLQPLCLPNCGRQVAQLRVFAAQVDFVLWFLSSLKLKVEFCRRSKWLWQTLSTNRTLEGSMTWILFTNGEDPWSSHKWLELQWYAELEVLHGLGRWTFAAISTMLTHSHTGPMVVFVCTGSVVVLCLVIRFTAFCHRTSLQLVAHLHCWGYWWYSCHYWLWPWVVYKSLFLSLPSALSCIPSPSRVVLPFASCFHSYVFWSKIEFWN